MQIVPQGQQQPQEPQQWQHSPIHGGHAVWRIVFISKLCPATLWLCRHAVDCDHSFISRPLTLHEAKYVPTEVERLLHVQAPQYYPQQAAPLQYGPSNPQGVQQPWGQSGQPQQQAPYQPGASLYASSSPASGQANPAWKPQQQQQGGEFMACSA
jgi:hypothetical protein